MVCASRNPRWARDYHTVQMPKEVRKARYFSRREELSDPELLSAIISRRDYYTDVGGWWRWQQQPMRLTASNSCRTVYAIQFFRFIWGEKSHPLALPLAPLLLEGNACDALCNAYQQYQDHFHKLKVSLPKLQDECWWEGKHDGSGREQNITPPGCSFKSSAVAVLGERTVNQGPWLSKEEPCTSQE